MEKRKLIIIGSGPAGLTAALYAARAGLNPLIFEGKDPGGQLMGTTEIENFPSFTGTGPGLMMAMKKQVQEFECDFVSKIITKVDFSDEKNLKLWAGEDEFVAESVIIATGAKARWLNLGKGEEKYWGKGYTACATCDGAFFRNKTVAVVGGGDTACEEAQFLTRFASKVYMFVRRDAFRASKPMQEKVFANEKIEVIWNTSVTGLIGENLLQKVAVVNNKTQETSEIALNGLFVAIGHTPNTEFLTGYLELLDNKYLKVNDNTKSNVKSVFIAGDCSDYKYRQAITAAGLGCMASLDCERYLESVE